MRRFLGDFRYGFRMFLKHPGFSLLSILALGLGIHLVTNQLLVINAFLFRGLSLPEADRIVDISRIDAAEEKPGGAFSPPELLALASGQTTLERMGGFHEGTVNLSGGKSPIRLHGAFITWGFLDVIGVNVARGRGFVEADADPSAPRAVIISHRAWVNEFGRDPTLINRSVRMNAQPGVIIGVMPEGVHFPLREDAWTPVSGDLEVEKGELEYYRAFGRLKPGVEVEDARADLNTVAARYVDDAHGRWKDFAGVEVSVFHRGYLRPEDFSMLWIMLLAVSLVLFIACANVANLLLVRSTARGRELAIRSAVGVSRGRLIAQMLAESFALCVAGGILGVLSTMWSMEGLNRQLAAANLPYWVAAGFDARVLLVVLLITVVCSCLAGIIPALRASRIDILELLNETGRTSTNLYVGWFGRTVIGVQVATAFALLIVAGMMIRTLADMRSVDLPRVPSEILSARFGLFEGDGSRGPGREEFLGRLVAGLTADPQVEAAAVTDRQQFDATTRVPVSIGGGEAFAAREKPHAFVEGISPGYLRTVGVAVIKGRDFTSEDVAGRSMAALVNTSFVRRFLPDRDPLGAVIQLHGKETEVVTVVGVVPDLSMNGAGIDIADQSGLYLPIDPVRGRFFTVILGTSGDAGRLEGLLRRTVRALDPDLPLYWVQTYAAAIDRSVAAVRTMTTMFLVFGAATVVLAAVEIYRVVSFIVSQRTLEIGIRMALGAQSGTILALFVRQGAAQLAGGLLAGTILALAFGGIIRRFFVVIGASDVTLFAVVGMVLSLVVLFSSLLPARRAVRLSPLEALRHD